jgi:hypothetical protein
MLVIGEGTVVTAPSDPLPCPVHDGGRRRSRGCRCGGGGRGRHGRRGRGRQV